MGSVPNASINTETLPIVTTLTPQESTYFIDKVKSSKYHSSVVGLKRAAHQTRVQVDKALNLINHNLSILQTNNRQRFHSRSINMIEVQKRKKRVVTEIQQKKQIYSSVVVKPKLPQIKTNKRQLVKNGFKAARQKTSSALSIIYSNKK